MKKFLLLIAMLAIQTPILFSKTAPVTSPVTEKKQTVDSDAFRETIAELEKMSDKELAALCEREGLDIKAMRDVLTDQTKMPGFLRPAPTPGKAPFSELVAAEQKKYPLSDDALKYSSLLYYGPEAEKVPEPKSGIIEVTEKYDAFLDKHIRGKKLQKTILVGYILYRQATWIYSTWLVEKAKNTKEEDQVNKFKNTFFGQALSVTGMDSRLIESADVMIRTAFCGTRLWLDLSGWFQRFKQPYLWADDPDSFFREFYQHWRRSYYYFSNPFYYGSGISVIKRVLLGLSLPLAWCSLFSKHSPGNPMGNRLFQTASSAAVGTIAVESGWAADQWFEQKVSLKKQRRLFNKSAGIIRERLFTDMAWWVAKYVRNKHIYDRKQQDFTPHMARCMGKYVVRHVYMQGAIEALKVFCRNGGINGIGWVGNKTGWLLSKMGFFRRNPANQVKDQLKHLCLQHDLIHQNQNLNEVLVYPAVIFPGAFARAVTQVVSKQMLPFVEEQEPRFVEYLNNMNGVSPYDLLRVWPHQPMIIHTMWESVNGVRQALPPAMWAKVLDKFLNEMIIDAVFNRERLVCQYFTEGLIGWMSKPILKKLNNVLLPSKAK